MTSPVERTSVQYMTNNYFRVTTTAYAKMYLAARVEFLARRAIRIAREGK